MNISPEVKDMIAAIPPRDANSVGKLARATILNKLIYSTPGQSTDIWSRENYTFLSFFYPGTAKLPIINNISNITSLPDSYWQSFSVALLCQEIWDQAPGTRRLIFEGNPQRDIDLNNQLLEPKLTTWYSYIFKTTFKEFSTPFNLLSDPTQALKEYSYWITSPLYLEAMKGLQNPISDVDLTWLFYHHWHKLLILGASEQEIKTIYQTILNKGLPLSPVIDPSNWKQYRAWYQPGKFSAADIDPKARRGVQASKVRKSGFPALLKEAYSEDFLMKYGSVYYKSPTSSCFDKNTKVLMSDGSSKTITDVALGDILNTPSGPRKVVMMPRPVRGPRIMYRIDDFSFSFTDSHPFVNFSASNKEHLPDYLSIDPWRLRYAVPTMAQLGVGKIESGCKLSTKVDGKMIPYQVEKIYDYQIKNKADKGELLYDLILEPNESGRSHYFVGSNNKWLLVASEMPVFTEAPMTTIAMLELTTVSAQHVLSKLGGISHVNFNDKMHEFLSALPDLMEQSLRRLSHQNISIEKGNAELHTIVSEYLKKFNYTDQSGNHGHLWQLGQYYESLAFQFADEMTSAIELGWRSSPLNMMGDWLAISFLDLHLNDSHTLDPKFQPQFIANFGLNHKEILKISSDREHSFFAHHIDHICYLPKSDFLNFQLDINLDNEMIFEANETLSISKPYTHTEIVVKDMDNKSAGLLSLDVRILTLNQIEKEKIKRKTWTPLKKKSFAKALGKSMALSISS